MISYEKIQEVAHHIVKEFHPEKIILFGSYAWGTPGPDSDVDFFIIKESDHTTLDMMREVGRIMFGKPFPSDVLVYTPQQTQRRLELGDPFLKRVVELGKVLYAK